MAKAPKAKAPKADKYGRYRVAIDDDAAFEAVLDKIMADNPDFEREVEEIAERIRKGGFRL